MVLHQYFDIKYVPTVQGYHLALGRVCLQMTAASWADPEGGRVPDPPLPKNHESIGFLCNTGPDHLKNHKATKPALNIGPSSARQRNAI